MDNFLNYDTKIKIIERFEDQNYWHEVSIIDTGCSSAGSNASYGQPRISLNETDNTYTLTGCCND